ncbi:hypothetical protein SAMN04488136_13813 [Vibrio xiamenensis]|uniref:Uncharacterized protein n=1 Tax=Vibrio xiamenensis TaxID=861298 RepID=A0A1G8GJE8_9VIBR|nr:hypothetical protein SAMN04488136_13813 [Vibrio xiamenensis]
MKSSFRATFKPFQNSKPLQYSKLLIHILWNIILLISSAITLIILPITDYLNNLDQGLSSIYSSWNWSLIKTVSIISLFIYYYLTLKKLSVTNKSILRCIFIPLFYIGYFGLTWMTMHLILVVYYASADFYFLINSHIKDIIWNVSFIINLFIGYKIISLTPTYPDAGNT